MSTSKLFAKIIKIEVKNGRRIATVSVVSASVLSATFHDEADITDRPDLVLNSDFEWPLK